MNKRTCVRSFQSLLCAIIVFAAVFPVHALAGPGEVPSSQVATEASLGSEHLVTTVLPGSASSPALNLAPSPQHEGDAGEVLSIVVAPQDVMAGQQVTFTIRTLNTGTTTWDPNDVAAEVVVFDEEGNPLAIGHGADAMPFESVAPGAEASVTVFLQVPVDWAGAYQYTTKVWVKSTLLEAHTQANDSLEVSPMMGPIDIRQDSTAMWVEGISAAGESGGGQAVDLVFAMDTSGSMYDEFSALCGKIDDIIADLQGRGITVRYRILGITATRECATDTVSNLVSGATSNHVEDWGPATYDLSNGYDLVGE